jgi:hypothetical protein
MVRKKERKKLLGGVRNGECPEWTRINDFGTWHGGSMGQDW